MSAGGAHGAKTGAVTVVQRTSSDLRLNPHLHVVFLDGAYHEAGDALAWEQLGHLKTREVGEVLERALRRMARYLRRHGALETAEGADAHADDDAALEKKLAASAVSRRAPLPDRNGYVGSRRSRLARSRTTSRCARRWTASRCTPRRGRARSTSRDARRSCATCSDLRLRKSGSSRVPMGSCASC